MHNIEMHEASDELAKCWQAAGRHLLHRGDGQVNWLKADLVPPFLEHLSFRLGNRLFYVRLVDVDGKLETPGNHSGLQAIADGCQGFACLMPMRLDQGQWTPAEPDWGLFDLKKDYSVVNYSTIEIEYHLQKILSYPIFLTVMSILSIVLMMNIKFQKSKVIYIIFGILLSVTIYYINYFFGIIGKNERLPLLVALWLPQVILIIISIIGSIKINEK